MIKLNLGCGYDVREGFVNIDKYPVNNKVMKVDLTKKLPFKDDTFDYVYSYHVLEHILNVSDLIKEIWRICKSGAIIEIYVPHFSAAGGFSTEHIRHFTSSSFTSYCIDECEEKYLREHHCIPRKLPLFELLKTDIKWSGGFNPLNWIGRIFNVSQRIRELYEETVLKCIFPARELYFKLEVIK